MTWCVRGTWAACVGGVLLACGMAGCATVAPEPVLPQRASFCSDPTTTAEGTFETEFGVLAAEDNRVDVPVLVKWGSTDHTELYCGWSPYVRLASRDVAPDGHGDLVLGSRIRVRDETARGPAAAFELFTKLPVANRESGVGTGLVDVFVAGSVSKAFDLNSVVGYYQLGVLSNPDGRSALLEHLVSGAVSRPVHGPVQAFAEVAGVFTPAQDLSALLLGLGIGYVVHPNVVFDAEAFVGLTHDAEAFVLALGITANVGNPF